MPRKEKSTRKQQAAVYAHLGKGMNLSEISTRHPTLKQAVRDVRADLAIQLAPDNSTLRTTVPRRQM